MTIYDNHFNSNEWFLICLLIAVYVIFFLLPKRFPRQVTIVFLLYGIFVSYFFDLTIGLKPIDFYDVNDTSKYSIFDFITYVMFAPVSYLFFYIYDRMKIHKRFTPLYILMWACVAMFMEWVSKYLGVYHYRLAYEIYYSFGIYLAVLSVGIILYHRIQNSLETEKHSQVSFKE
ncbi:hypothetical protein HNQ94_000261 [Salirhabdus euzebyi]|uniref:Uncharacterized protein n=1 Tax=Salirhabdus euzebyi TaxID=394506 RepID=A0A841PSS6_9BACI|nr:hypothetical protein [Salirhabdus euzebyi]MBB6451840.1 hypothetical protein [Salirhabdus euzebyi]